MKAKLINLALLPILCCCSSKEMYLKVDRESFVKKAEKTVFIDYSSLSVTGTLETTYSRNGSTFFTETANINCDVDINEEFKKDKHELATKKEFLEYFCFLASSISDYYYSPMGGYFTYLYFSFDLLDDCSFFVGSGFKITVDRDFYTETPSFNYQEIINGETSHNKNGFILSEHYKRSYSETWPNADYSYSRSYTMNITYSWSM